MGTLRDLRTYHVMEKKMTDPAAAIEPIEATQTTAETAALPANNNDPQPPAPVEPPKVSKKAKVLSAIFNMAAGATATMSAKALVTTAMMGCPPLAILLASSLAVGAVMTVACHEGQRRKLKKENGGAPDCFSKQNMKELFCNKARGKTFLKSSLFALAGGALFLGFSEGIIQDGISKIFDWGTPAPVDVTPSAHAPVAAMPVEVTPTVETIVPVEAIPVTPAPCVSPLEHLTDTLKDHVVSDRVQNALERAHSVNPHVAAQATKDLAYFAFNGLDGVPKDAGVALELFQKAAEAGNVQAKIDLLYMQFHGLSGITANPQAAVEAMQEIPSPRAALFVEKWAAMGQHATDRVGGFDAKAILQGVKLCAPAV